MPLRDIVTARKQLPRIEFPFLLKNVNTRMIKLAFGIVVVLLGMEMLSRQHSKNRVRSSKILLAVIGIASGVLCGLFGVGALLAAYVSRVTDNSASFKANISNVFFIENTFRMILYGILQILTFETAGQAESAGFRPCKRCRSDLLEYKPMQEIAADIRKS